jgi:ABC-type Fe3+-hydroxamate transport system substrate-binding protein
MRVVSLVPSVTETLLAWGVQPVGVTRFCEHPELPMVGGTKDPDLAAIAALAPDLVVLCDEENRLEDAEALAAAGLATHVVHIQSVDEVFGALVDLAAAVDAPTPEPPLPEPPLPETGQENARYPGAKMPNLRGDGPGDGRALAFVPIWRRPWMTLNATCYGSSVLDAIGIGNVFADDAERYPTTTLDEVAARRPDLVIAPSEPYPFGPRHVAELEAVAPVELIDGQDLFWWGVRTPAALERLRARLA